MMTDDDLAALTSGEMTAAERAELARRIFAEAARETRLELLARLYEIDRPDECGCIIPSMSCPVCRKAARALYAHGEELQF